MGQGSEPDFPAIRTVRSYSQPKDRFCYMKMFHYLFSVKPAGRAHTSHVLNKRYKCQETVSIHQMAL